MIWFVVERFNGRQMAGIYYDRLPSKYQGKRAVTNGLVVAIRIDDKPHLERRTLAQLLEAWQLLGTLDQLHEPTWPPHGATVTWPFG